MLYNVRLRLLCAALLCGFCGLSLLEMVAQVLRGDNRRKSVLQVPHAQRYTGVLLGSVPVRVRPPLWKGRFNGLRRLSLLLVGTPRAVDGSVQFLRPHEARNPVIVVNHISIGATRKILADYPNLRPIDRAATVRKRSAMKHRSLSSRPSRSSNKIGVEAWCTSSTSSSSGAGSSAGQPHPNGF